MREILFRGKRKANGEWVQGGLMGNRFIIDPKYGAYGVIPETVGQYTGLTDKNGKKIFEGDIVKVPIYYDCGCYPHTDNETRVVETPDVYRWRVDGNLEVIGNIHDNPELLGGAKMDGERRCDNDS